MKTKISILFALIALSFMALWGGSSVVVNQEEKPEAGEFSFANISLRNVLSTLVEISRNADGKGKSLILSHIRNEKLSSLLTIKKFKGSYIELINYIADLYKLEFFLGKNGKFYISDAIQYSLIIDNADYLKDNFSLFSDFSFGSLTLPTRSIGEKYGMYFKSRPNLVPVLLEMDGVPSTGTLQNFKKIDFINNSVFFLTSDDFNKSDLKLFYFGGTISSLSEKGTNALLLYLDSSALSELDVDGSWQMKISLFDKALGTPMVRSLGQLYLSR